MKPLPVLRRCNVCSDMGVCSLAQEIVPTYGDNPIAIVSPDAGGVARAKMFMEAMTSMKVCVCVCVCVCVFFLRGG